jgi:hypothetical protein
MVPLIVTTSFTPVGQISRSIPDVFVRTTRGAIFALAGASADDWLLEADELVRADDFELPGAALAAFAAFACSFASG